jgi:hypothetical protein
MFTSEELRLENNQYTMLDVINVVKGPNGIHCQVVLRVCFQDLHFKKLKLMFFFSHFFIWQKWQNLASCPPPPPFQIVFQKLITSWSLLGPGVEVGLTPSFIDYVRLSLN